MKKVLLTSIAALFLATGAAEARSFEDYHCGKHVIEYVFEKYFTPNQEPCDGGPCDSKGHYFVIKPETDIHRRVDRAIRVRNDKTFYKGQKCREFTQDEYNAR